MVQISLEEAKTKLPELIKAAIQGEKVFIKEDENQMIQLVPIATRLRKPQFGCAKGLIEMAPDFDEPLEDFKEYMQ